MAFRVSADPGSTDEQVDRTSVRDSIVYANYCVLCHGDNADGNGRMAPIYLQQKLPGPANLLKSQMPQNLLTGNTSKDFSAAEKNT